ncbi:DapH/DapD/GlmU-related protein [uncultured Wocania sp.]|uniref:DapH/DapD/GlmU-related protein n=1 Tax=uncultured Wocania sp. TaxID=2834404 RepID=UPI0030F9A3A4
MGRNINISRYCFVSNSVIGDYTSVGRNTTIINAEISKFCSISWNVTIGATQHNYKRVSTHAFSYIEYYGFVEKDLRIIVRTFIGHDVWIGANSIVMPGVRVGNGAVIGAGSVVTKDVNDFEIVYGVPAISKGYRFNQKTIEDINQLNWWHWEDKKIKENIEIFKKPFSKR